MLTPVENKSLNAPWMTRWDRFRFTVMRSLLTPRELMILQGDIGRRCQEMGSEKNYLPCDREHVKVQQETRRQLYFVFAWMRRRNSD